MARSTLRGDTGQGATVVAASGLAGWTARVQGIEVSEEMLELLNVSGLETQVYNIRIASDLRDPSQVRVMFYEDTFDARPVIGSAISTLTITAPLRTGEVTAANLAGSAIVRGYKPPDYKLGEVQMGILTLDFDGVTGPTYTKST